MRTATDPGTAELPPPRRTDSPYVVVLVCLGNICRSPMAAVVLSEKVRRMGLGSLVEVRSCGTGDWHVGEEMDSRAAAVLITSGYNPSRHRAAHFDSSWLDFADVLLAMDHQNFADICAAAKSPESGHRVMMFRCFDPESGWPDRDLPDPWYGGPTAFEATLDIVERTTDSLVEALQQLLR
jgi:low molecular weight protein-tyrosine phosphatase